jgi:hypothetical protein
VIFPVSTFIWQTQLQQAARDCAKLESIRLEIDNIARLLGVPPNMLSEDAARTVLRRILSILEAP